MSWIFQGKLRLSLGPGAGSEKPFRWTSCRGVKAIGLVDQCGTATSWPAPSISSPTIGSRPWPASATWPKRPFAARFSTICPASGAPCKSSSQRQGLRRFPGRQGRQNHREARSIPSTTFAACWKSTSSPHLLGPGDVGPHCRRPLQSRAETVEKRRNIQGTVVLSAPYLAGQQVRSPTPPPRPAWKAQPARS